MWACARACTLPAHHAHTPRAPTLPCAQTDDLTTHAPHSSYTNRAPARAAPNVRAGNAPLPLPVSGRMCQIATAGGLISPSRMSPSWRCRRLLRRMAPHKGFPQMRLKAHARCNCTAAFPAVLVLAVEGLAIFLRHLEGAGGGCICQNSPSLPGVGHARTWQSRRYTQAAPQGQGSPGGSNAPHHQNGGPPGAHFATSTTFVWGRLLATGA